MNRARWVGLGVVLVVFSMCALGLIRVGSLWSIGRIGWYDGQSVELAAAPEAGFEWPYRLYIPKSILQGKRPVRFWLRPNNSSDGADDDAAVHHADAEGLLAVSRRPADALDLVVLVPSFPRPAEPGWLYTHALDRDTILERGPMGGLDEQLLAMRDHAAAVLSSKGLAVCDKDFADGFSASGMFVSRLSLIHPDRFAAVAIGAPGGWPMVPAAFHEGEFLRYPTGIGDFGVLFGRTFPASKAAVLPRLFYMGDGDINDAVPYDDAWEPAASAQIQELFGATPIERWDDAEALYEGYRTTFRLHEGVGHRQTAEMREEMSAFFARYDDRTRCGH